MPLCPADEQPNNALWLTDVACPCIIRSRKRKINKIFDQFVGTNVSSINGYNGRYVWPKIYKIEMRMHFDVFKLNFYRQNQVHNDYSIYYSYLSWHRWHFHFRFSIIFLFLTSTIRLQLHSLYLLDLYYLSIKHYVVFRRILILPKIQNRKTHQNTMKGNHYYWCAMHWPLKYETRLFYCIWMYGGHVGIVLKTYWMYLFASSWIRF